MVYEAIAEGGWAMDIGPTRDMERLVEYMGIWPRVAAVQHFDLSADRVAWYWERDNKFSARSAYAAKFVGREVSPTVAFTWRSWTLLECKFFAWLATMNQFWTLKRATAPRFMPFLGSA